MINHKFPLVSVCIPAFNSEKWIKETIMSVVNQSWTNKEIIVIDDGSLDNTLDILEDLKSFGIKVFSQQNRGACAARNHAFSLAKGDFIQWLDADDILEINKIELQLKEVDFDPNTEILLSASYAKFYYSPLNAKFLPNPLWVDLEPKEWLIKHLRDQAIMYPHAWLVSRKISELAGEWNENLSLNQDGEYFCRVVAASKFVKFVPDAKCYYRTGNVTSLSNKRSRKNLESLSLANNLCVNHLLKLENSEATRNACLIFLQRFASKIYYEEDELEFIQEINDRIRALGGKIPSRKESKKFHFVRSILGLKTARYLKDKLWSLEIISRKYLDKIRLIMRRN